MICAPPMVVFLTIGQYLPAPRRNMPVSTVFVTPEEFES